MNVQSSVPGMLYAATLCLCDMHVQQEDGRSLEMTCLQQLLNTNRSDTEVKDR